MTQLCVAVNEAKTINSVVLLASESLRRTKYVTGWLLIRHDLGHAALGHRHDNIDHDERLASVAVDDAIVAVCNRSIRHLASGAAGSTTAAAAAMAAFVDIVALQCLDTSSIAYTAPTFERAATRHVA